MERERERPAEVTLSREDGEALLTRLESEALTAEARRVGVQGRPVYFWRLFAVREAKLSLKRLKPLGCGEKAKKRAPPEPGGAAGGGRGTGGTGAAAAESAVRQGAGEGGPAAANERRRGHGRQSAAG